ncbi:uncharacterized protein BJ212DRAFT_1241382, partial [Suillus subaureus]
DGSKWMVSEDWEDNTGLINDLLQISTNIKDSTALQLLERFTDEPVFREVVKAMLQIDRGTTVHNQKWNTRHRASQYLIKNGKLWKLQGGTAVRAHSKVECINREEAQAQAVKQHSTGSHWGWDMIKIALTDQIYSPKLDTSIMAAI